MQRRYPSEIEIAPAGPLAIDVRPPGSKSLTNRALVVAAQADGISELHGALVADDTEAMAEALERLGIVVDRQGERWTVVGRRPPLPGPGGAIDVRASGTTARFVTALATVADARSRIDGIPRMRERPIGPLTAALRALGADVRDTAGFPPVEVVGPRLAGGEVTVDAGVSSQFASAVLMVAPSAQHPVTVHLGGDPVSVPYLTATTEVMAAFGVEVLVDGTTFRVPAPATYRPTVYEVEADASAAIYPASAAAVTGGRARIRGIRAGSSQADLGAVDALGRMGARVERRGDAIEVVGGPLRGIDVDARGFPDGVLALAVVAAHAEGPSRFRGIRTLRVKETDRVAALAAELHRLGARVESGPDEIVVHPPPAGGPARGARIRTYDDHRMAMAFSIAGLVRPGVVIDDPGVVAKTWPGFWDEFARWVDSAGRG